MLFMADKAATITIKFKMLSAYGIPTIFMTITNGLVASAPIKTVHGTKVTIRNKDNK